MDEALKALRHLGVTTNIILIIVAVIAVVYLYKTTLETQKLHLEIARLKNNNNTQLS